MHHKGIYRIGSARTNDWVFSDSSVLSFHAEIFVDVEQNVFLTPLNPRGECFVRNKRIYEPVLLERGSQLRLGRQIIDWEYRLFGVRSQEPSIFSRKESTKVIESTENRNENIQLWVIYSLIVIILIILNFFI